MALYLLAQDHIQDVEAPAPEGCNCEQALQVTTDRLAKSVVDLQDEVVSLKQMEQDAWTLAEEVLQATTLEDAKAKASIYLGLTTPF
jgi:hypothetical protein